MDETPRAIVYTRISLDATGEGEGVERQGEFCRSLCDARQWRVMETITDNSVSASAKDRPGWERVLKMMRSGDVDVVVVWRLDRLTRSARQLLDLIALSKETGVKVATVEGDIDLSTTGGGLVGTILAAVAQAEMEAKADRQKAAHSQRRQRGGSWWTRRPLGYEKDGSICEEEAALIRQAYKDVEAGASLSSIAREWADLGVTTSEHTRWVTKEDGITREKTTLRGNPVRATTLRQLLLSERNIAMVTEEFDQKVKDSDGRNVLDEDGSPKTIKARKTIGPGDWEPLIDVETFEHVRRILTSPNRRMGQHSTRRSGLLTGVLVCGDCGGAMGSRTTQTAKGAVYSYAACRRGHNSWPKEWTEEHVTRLVEGALTRDRLTPTAERPNAANLQRELERLDARTSELLVLRRTNAISGVDLQRELQVISEERKAVHDAMSALGDEHTLQRLGALKVAERLEYLKGLDTDGLRDLILSLFGRIVAQPRGRGIKPSGELLAPEVGTFASVLRGGVVDGGSVSSETFEAIKSSTSWTFIPATKTTPETTD